MFGYAFIIEKVWSKNILLPKESILKSKFGNVYYPSGRTNHYKKGTWRLKLSIVKKNLILK